MRGASTRENTGSSRTANRLTTGRYNPDDDDDDQTLAINFGSDNIELKPGDNVFRVVSQLTAIKGCQQKTRLICEQIYNALSQSIIYRPTWQKQMVRLLANDLNISAE